MRGMPHRLQQTWTNRRITRDYPETLEGAFHHVCRTVSRGARMVGSPPAAIHRFYKCLRREQYQMLLAFQLGEPLGEVFSRRFADSSMTEEAKPVFWIVSSSGSPRSGL
jgi:hypothetical protein